MCRSPYQVALSSQIIIQAKKKTKTCTNIQEKKQCCQFFCTNNMVIFQTSKFCFYNSGKLQERWKKFKINSYHQVDQLRRQFQNFLLLFLSFTFAYKYFPQKKFNHDQGRDRCPLFVLFKRELHKISLGLFQLVLILQL